MKPRVQVGIWVVVGCAAMTAVLGLSAAEKQEDVVAPLPASPAVNLKEVELGKRLFFDPRLSGDATLSCAECHNPKKAWTDGLALSKGYPTSLYFRNTPTLLNTVHKKLLYWDGRLSGDDLPTVVRDHLSEAHFMQADGRLVIERLRQVPEYEAMFQATYGEEPSYGKILNALSAYLTSLVSEEVPLDRHLAGDTSALSDSAKRGLALFQGKARCAQCHYGPMLTDEQFHRLGMKENPEVFNDPLRHITFRRFFKTLGVEGYHALRQDVGLYAITKESQDKGKFKTPSLREVARTPPYMHNGTIESLEAVVEFYDQGGGDDSNKDPLLTPLGLSEQEKGDLVEFLKSLSSRETAVEPPPLAEYQLREIGGLVSVGLVMAESPREESPEAVPEIGPLPPVPVPADNPMTPKKVELGKKLFFDPRLSGDGSISCASCHNPRMGWGDGNDLSRGYPGTQHWRNSQTVLNAAYYTKLFWAGEALSLEKQADSAITGNLAGNGDPMMIEERLRQVPEYVKAFREVFGQDPQYVDALKAIAAFERAEVISRNVPFDNYMKGDENALSAQAKQGLALFKGKARCIQCHNGALFSDQDLHNLSVPKNPAFEEDPLRQIALRYQHRARGVDEAVYRNADGDLGLYYTTKREEDKGKFRTPSLRELAYTAPYMHNGVFFTLNEVVDFYDKGGGDDPHKSPRLQPLNLSQEEKDALVAYLESLSGDEIIVDPPPLPEYATVEPEGKP